MEALIKNIDIVKKIRKVSLMVDIIEWIWVDLILKMKIIERLKIGEEVSEINFV